MKIRTNNIRAFIYIFLVSLLAISSTSCEDMLDTESTDYAFDREENLKNPNDSLYSVMGILSQLQKIGERYVLLGELRGDLMALTDKASVSLKEISQLQFTADNEYADKVDYYSIINNCNYAIARMDTTLTNYQDKIMLPEFAAIKTIRAWTYLQIAQIFGTAYYYTEPILNLETSMQQYPALNMEQLIDKLIPDLLPYIDVRPLDYGSIDGWNSRCFFIPVRMLLGDMYLYQNNYTQAAVMYHDLMEKQYYTLNKIYCTFWDDRNRSSATTGHTSTYIGEIMSMIAYSTDARDYHTSLFRLSYNARPVLVPEESFVEKMNASMYFFSDINKGSTKIDAYLSGDLRGVAKSPSVSSPGSFGPLVFGTTGVKNIIVKYSRAITSSESGWDPENEEVGMLYYPIAIPIYRIPHLYLRYAEAINRAGKPSLAFAVLKHGLRQEVVDSATIVNPAEVAAKETYIQFNSTFDSNIPTAMRGRGQGVNLDKTEYVIPALPTREDSILFVEDCILDELAAETSFEGNRFFDLLRISHHRSNHPELMADKVSVRFPDPAAAKARLMTIDNWYMK